MNEKIYVFGERTIESNFDHIMIIPPGGGKIYHTEHFNPYSWTLDYFDDWRCVADYLRENNPH